MKISVVRRTTRFLITSKAKFARSFDDRLLGLLNPQNPRFLILKTHFGIHTLFLQKPIDVLLIDNNQRIVKLQPSLLPFRLFVYHPQYSLVVEMPQGTINRFHLHLNDKILLDETAEINSASKK